LRVFAVTQIAASFVLVAGAGMLITTLFALQRQQTGFTGNVLAVNVPVVSYERKPAEVEHFYKEMLRRVDELPGVEQVAVGAVVPWRDPGFSCCAVHHRRLPQGQWRGGPAGAIPDGVPRILSALGVRMVAGRDFNDGDRRDGERVGHHQ
jgi:hypothetical protein